MEETKSKHDDSNSAKEVLQNADAEMSYRVYLESCTFFEVYDALMATMSSDVLELIDDCVDSKGALIDFVCKHPGTVGRMVNYLKEKKQAINLEKSSEENCNGETDALLSVDTD